MSAATEPTDRLALQQVASPAALLQAWDHVRRAGDAPGSDGVTLGAFGADHEAHCLAMSRDLIAQTWSPAPLRRVEIDDGARCLQIPTVADRVVHRALATALSERVDPLLQPSSFAYRPGRGVGGALRALEAAMDAGRKHIRLLDIAACFDSLPHDVVLGKLRAARLVDAATLSLVARIMGAGLAVHGPHAGVGIPQGSAVSPVLCNLALDDLDRAAHSGEWFYARYGDDLIVAAAAHDTLGRATRAIELALGHLGLSLRLAKTETHTPGASFGWLGAWFVDGRARVAQRTRTRIAHAVGRVGWTPAGASAAADAWVASERPLELLAEAGLAGVYAAAAQAARDGRTDRLEAIATHRTTAAEVAPVAGVHARLAGWWLLVDSDAARAAFWHDVELEPAKRTEGSAPLDEALGVSDVLSRAATDDATLYKDVAAAGRPRLAEAGLRRMSRALLGVDTPPDWVEAWGGRCGGVLVERTGRRGRGLTPALDPTAAWHEHLAGRRRCSIRVLRSDGRCGVGIVRVAPDRDGLAVLRDALRGGGDARHVLAEYDRACTAAAYRIAEASRADGVACRVLQGSEPGAEVWWWLDEPVSAALMGRVLQRFARAADAGLPRDKVVWRTLVEPQPEPPRKGPGPVVVAPFGRHEKSRRVSRWLYPQPENPHDASAWLTIEAAAGARIQELGTRDATIAPAAPVRVGDGTAQRLLDGCAVLADMVERSARIGSMPSKEKRTMAEVARGFGTDTGRRVLSAWWAPHGAESHAVHRALRGAPCPPISCHRIRAKHGDVVGRVPCDCGFGELPGRSYPSPVLHVMLATQLDERVARANRASTAPRARAPVPGKARAAARTKTVEPKRHAPPSPPPQSSPSPPPPTALRPESGGTSDRLSQMALAVREASTRLADARAAHARACDRLDGAFDALGIEVLELSSGTLQRSREGEARFVWHARAPEPGRQPEAARREGGSDEATSGIPARPAGDGANNEID